MGGRPLEAMALIGLGIDRLSITPAAVGPIKAMIRSLDREKLIGDIAPMLAKPVGPLRETLRQWAEHHSVELA
jgi:phosphotransferase system, enzyme I, PtsP